MIGAANESWSAPLGRLRQAPSLAFWCYGSEGVPRCVPNVGGPSLGSVAGSGDVELVALGVGEQCPPALVAVVDGLDGRAEIDKALDLGVAGLRSDQ